MVGVAFGTGTDVSRYWSSGTTNSLNKVGHTGSNVIQISAYLNQIGLKSSTPAKQTNIKALSYIIRKAKKSGYKVFLKPTVYVSNEKGSYIWRGNIQPTWRWFNQLYIPYIMRMARLARREKVDILSVGSEYKPTRQSQLMWYYTIKKVRSVYKGKLTYIANHDSYFKVRFWKHLDFISIAAYFKLVPKTQKWIPNLRQTEKLFAARASRIQRWRRDTGLKNKGVLMAEVGFQSKGGLPNYRAPWDWDAQGNRNLHAQAKMYDAFTKVFLSQRWSLGIIFWHWDFDVSAGRQYSEDGYTPQNKPAEIIMTRRFKAYCHKR